ncbi:Epidermal growth factor-like protein 7 [Bagarius yarrelli]|uniref:Epidermal growth factor-like protein 7 n=1 Tax=Bagarius yarrelli TaxID=175774 RepID=A0A556TU28_BAGYA|nr:Epidermal growth factor-like protein 7 [Bagarius yarrelli]
MTEMKLFCSEMEHFTVPSTHNRMCELQKFSNVVGVKILAAEFDEELLEDQEVIFHSEGGDGGLVANVTEEVQILKNRVQLLEKKLEMVLAPFSDFSPPEEDIANRNGFLLDRTDFLSDQTNFLSHSLRQLDRIDSLSEQVSFLEERLGSCEYALTS